MFLENETQLIGLSHGICKTIPGVYKVFSMIWEWNNVLIIILNHQLFEGKKNDTNVFWKVDTTETI